MKRQDCDSADKDCDTVKAGEIEIPGNLRGVRRAAAENMTHIAKILYAIDILPTDDIRGRVPKARQSTAGSRLLARIEEKYPHLTARSKSHSRAVVAAAAGTAPALLLGIDVEWMAPNRPFDQIARMFLASSSAQVDAETFYRGWTFFEAYYKAFQRFPEETLVHAVIAHRSNEALRLGDGIGVTQLCVAGDFRACIVWQHEALETEISRL